MKKFIKKQVEDIKPYSEQSEEELEKGCITYMLLFSFFLFLSLIALMIIFLS